MQELAERLQKYSKAFDKNLKAHLTKAGASSDAEKATAYLLLQKESLQQLSDDLASARSLEPLLLGRINFVQAAPADGAGRRFVHVDCRPAFTGNPFAGKIELDGAQLSNILINALFAAASANAIVGVRKITGTAEFIGEVILFPPDCFAI